MNFETWHLLLLAVVGVASGWMNVMAGGGSMLTVPIMLFLGMPGPVANGTNRIGILFQNISAAITFFKKGFSDFKLNLSLSLCAGVGAVGGASMGVQLRGVWFNYFLVGIMVAIMLLSIKKSHSSPQPLNTRPSKKRMVWGHFLMIGVGFWGGLIQIGVGFIIMPVLNRVMGFDLVRTNMYKVSIVLVYTIIALTIFASQVEIFWKAGLILAIGTSIGGFLGAHTSVQKGDAWIKRALNIILIIFIIKLLWPSLTP